MAIKFSRLTRPAIRALKPGEKLTEHGVIAERQKNGDVRYSVNVMVDRQRIHRVIGKESDGVTREQAERAIEIFRTKAREGRLDLPAGRKVHRTFGDLADAYIERIEHHSKHGRNLNRKRQHIQIRLVPYFKDQTLDKLTDTIISQFVRERKAEGAAQSTINRELSTLSHFLNRCMEWEWIKRRPKIEKGAEPRKQIVVLSDTQKQALLEAASMDRDPLTWLFTAIALGTGMRHSEILRIQWQEIDFAQQRIYVGRAKAGQREQPVPPVLSSHLEKQWNDLGKPDGYLFPMSRAGSKHRHRQSMGTEFRRAVELAKLDPAKVTPHILRHTAITALVKAGVDLPTIQKISGHKTLEMVLRYTQLSNEHVDRSVAVLDRFFAVPITQELHARADSLR
jgi:integrase